MSLAFSIDPVDVAGIAVVLLAYGLSFSILFAVSKIRQRKLEAAHRKRLEELRSQSFDR
jgi:hypothetical protein